MRQLCPSLRVMLAHIRRPWQNPLVASLQQKPDTFKLKVLQGVLGKCTWCISTCVFDSSLIMSPRKRCFLSPVLITVSIFLWFLPNIPNWCIDICAFICSCSGFMEEINSWQVKTSKNYWKKTQTKYSVWLPEIKKKRERESERMSVWGRQAAFSFYSDD